MYPPHLFFQMLYNLSVILHVSVSFGIQAMLLVVDIENTIHCDCYVNIGTHFIVQTHAEKCLQATYFLPIYIPITGIIFKEINRLIMHALQTQISYNTHISEIIHQLKHSKNINITKQYDTM